MTDNLKTNANNNNTSAGRSDNKNLKRTIFQTEPNKQVAKEIMDSDQTLSITNLEHVS